MDEMDAYEGRNWTKTSSTIIDQRICVVSILLFVATKQLQLNSIVTQAKKKEHTHAN